MTEAVASNRILTIPNLVSFARLLSVGLFWWVLLVQDEIAIAAWLVFIIGWTDWIDGYLARRLDQVSKLGKVLDPVADRLMIASAVIGGLIVGVLPLVVGVLLIVREVLVALLAAYLGARGGGTIDVRYLGKLATFLLYGAIPGFYLAGAGFLEGLMRPAAWITMVIGLALYWYVAVLYAGDARRRLAALKSPTGPQEV
ncbi:MAG: CDP-alcohol phosphatidyltransferase family protein [Actinomycetota bacterium]|nr:CDP-alcohol phosphatidyltransferase family protein [Actinomycetota bacterium]